MTCLISVFGKTFALLEQEREGKEIYSANERKEERFQEKVVVRIKGKVIQEISDVKAKGR